MKTRTALQPLYIDLSLAFVLFIILSAYVFTQFDNSPIFNNEGFISRSRADISSLLFFTSERPFTTDLFYKIFGSDPQKVIFGQQLLNIFAWIFLGISFAQLVKNRIIAISILLFCTSASLWWNIFGWTFVMRSESLSFSLFAIWMGLLLLYFQFKNVFLFLFLSAVTLLFSFTRDNIPVFLLFFLLLITVLMYLLNTKTWHQNKKLLFAYLPIVVIICTLQSLSAKYAHPFPRHTFNITNVFFQRILPDSKKTEWFQKKGMPELPDKKIWLNHWASSNNGIFFNNKRYQPFLKFIQNKSINYYGLYLFLHPNYTFSSAWTDRKQILTYNLFGYTGWLPADHSIIKIVSHFWYPDDNSLFMMLIIIVNLFLFKRYRKKINPPYCISMLLLLLVVGLQAGNGSILNFIILITTSIFNAWIFTKKGSIHFLIPLVLLLASIFNGLFVYHADAMEVWRHSLMTIVIFTIAYLLAILNIINLIFTENTGQMDVGSLTT